MGKKHRHATPFKPEEALERAIALHQGGRLADAEAIYRILPKDNPTVLQLLGVLCFQTNRRAEGADLLRQALSIDPNHVEALSNLAVVQTEDGDYTSALFTLERAIALMPSNPELLNKRGFVLQQLERHGEAMTSFRHALDLAQNFPDAWFNLGNSLHAEQDFAGAAQAFQRVLTYRPNDHEALGNWGSALVEMRKPAEAEQVLRRSIAIRPTANAYHSLASALSGLGQRESAIRAAKTAVDLSPRTPDHHLLLGILYRSFRQNENAIASLQKAYDLSPTDRTTIALASCLHQTGQIDAALTLLEQAPSPARRFLHALLVPVIPQSIEEMETHRQRVIRELESIAAEPFPIADPYREVGQTNFYWAYHSEGDLTMQRAAVEAYRRSCPDLAWIAPHCCEVKGRNAKTRVGVCSANLNRHTIGKLFRRLIIGLRSDDIEVVFFDASSRTDDWTKEVIDGADRSYLLTGDLFASRQLIADQKLDVLFYPDLGMDKLTYYLAFSRLAPVQMTTWGHPSSTALPHMDYFLSSDGLEREHSEDDYSEKLVKFKNLMTVFTRPELPTAKRADLGLPEDKRIYVCPQTSFKLHPDFDQVFAKILRQDPEAQIVLIQGLESHWDRLLKQRFQSLMPEVAHRIVFVEKLSTENFIALNSLADAVLDTFYFGGGNTSLEAFSAGTPIVTWPGQLLRGRITLAQYRMMGIDDLIARDPDHFVELALRLANDRDWHAELSKRILQNCHVLYDNPSPIEELRRFVLSH